MPGVVLLLLPAPHVMIRVVPTSFISAAAAAAAFSYVSVPPGPMAR